MKKTILFISVMILLNIRLNAQGCVAIRTVGGLNTMEHAMHEGMELDKDSTNWYFNMSFRYFKSYKHFNGTDEQTQRVLKENK